MAADSDVSVYPRQPDVVATLGMSEAPALEIDVISEEVTAEETSVRAKFALLAANFFIETNRMEAFLGVYLITFKNWDVVNFGYVSALLNIVMLVSQTPSGALLDNSEYKKSITVVATLVAAVTTAGVVWSSEFWVVMLLKACEGIAAAIFLPALMSLLLGVVPPNVVAQTVGLTEASNKIGSVLFTTSCGALAYFAYPDVEGVFYLLAAGGVCAACFIMLIPDKSIDHDRACSSGKSVAKSRSSSLQTEKDEELAPPSSPNLLIVDQPMTGEEGKVDPSPAPASSPPAPLEDPVKEEEDQISYTELLKDPAIRVFAVVTFVYHLANAGVVQLASQLAALDDKRTSLAFTAASLTIFYLVQAPTAYLMGKHADRFHYKTMLIVAHCILPVRCAVLAALSFQSGADASTASSSPNPYAVVSTQIFDGLAAGVYDTMMPLVSRRLCQGSGHFGFTFGFFITCWRVGHGLSVLLGEFILHEHDYGTAFVTLGSIGVVASLSLTFIVTIPDELGGER